VTGDSTWCRYDAVARRALLALHVQPGARKNEVAGLHGEALKIRIAAPAAEDKANAELVQFLSKALAVPRSAIAIRRGAKSRHKLVEIAGGPEILTKLRSMG
jgi:uncharacterized protein (TIGR00251 family)